MMDRSLRLGHALFERRGKQLVLTEAGRIALDHADAIFARGDDLESALQGRGKERRVLRVGSLATLSRNFQLGFLRPLFGRDDVEIVVRSGAFAEMLRALEAHLIDVLLANVALGRRQHERLGLQELLQAPLSSLLHRRADQADGLLGDCVRDPGRCRVTGRRRRASTTT